LGRGSGKSEEHARKVERKVYFDGREILFDKTSVIIFPLTLFVVV